MNIARIALILAAFFFLVMALCLYFFMKTRRQKVVSNSKRIKALLKLKEEIRPNFDYPHAIRVELHCKSKKEFDKEDVAALAKTNAHKLEEPYSIKLENAFKAKEFQRHAAAIYKSLPPSQEDIQRSKLSEEAFLKIEKKEFDKLALFPEDEEEITLQCVISYSSPTGKNQYENSKTYKAEAFDLKEKKFEPIPFEMPSFDPTAPSEAAEKEIQLEGITYRLTKTEAILLNGKESKGTIKLPRQVEGLPLKRIAMEAFMGNEALEKVGFSPSVIEIGERAFKSCSNLASVKLNDGLSSIKDGAFQNCTSLSKASLPKTLKELGGEAFSFCSSLKSIVLPESLDRVGPGAFWHSDALKIKSPLSEEKPSWDRSWNNEEKEIKWGYQSSK